MSKLIQKALLVMLTLVVFSQNSFAQESAMQSQEQEISQDLNRWSLDLYVGDAISRNTRSGGVFFGAMGVNSSFFNPALGAAIRYSHSPYLSTQVNLGYASMSEGKNPNDLTYSNSILNGSIRANINLINLFELHQFGENFGLYSFVGVGASYYSVKDITGAPDIDTRLGMMHTVGAGTRFRLNHNTDFFVEYDFNRYYTPRVDGYPDLAPRRGGSNISTVKVGLTFRFGSEDREHADWVRYDRGSMMADIASLKQAQAATNQRLNARDQEINDLMNRMALLEEQFDYEKFQEMDSRITSLEERLENMDLSGDATGMIEMLNTVNFGFDQASLSSTATQQLTNNVRRLLDNPNTQVRVVAYTDHIGGDQYNLRLSLRRADSVADYYISNGVSQNRIQRSGLGKAPVQCTENEMDSNTPGCIVNRRAESHLIAPQN